MFTGLSAFPLTPMNEHAIDEAYTAVCHGYSRSMGAGLHTVTLTFSGGVGCRIGNLNGFMIGSKR